MLAPLAVVAALIALWQLAAQWDLLADALDIEPFLVPAPSEIAESLWDDRELLAENAWVTLQEVVFGLAIALVVGYALAVALHLSPTLRRAFYPLLVASQTVPVIAIAPILIVWFGFGIGPKLAIIALVCFFPVTVNTLDGLRAVDPALPRMMRTLDADRWQILRRVEMPASLPYFFSGAKIAAAIAVIGAVFGEWSGASEGLGHLILTSQAQLLIARVFAAVVVLSAIALALVGALALAQRRFAGWSLTHRKRDRRQQLVREGAVRTRVVAVAVTVAAMLAGCGEKEETVRGGQTEPFTVALDFYVNPDHAGIFRALERGDFSEAGLDVETQVPADPSAPIRQVAAGRADLAISYEPEVLLALDQGLPVKAVAALVDAATHVADLAPRGGHPRARRPRRQDDRDRGHPVPGGVPRVDPRRRGAAAGRRRTGRRRAGPACPPSCRAGPTRCSAAS